MPQSTDRVKYDIDNVYQLDYGLVNQQERYGLNQVGPCVYIELTDTDDISTDPAITTMCMFFDPSAGDDDTGDGTVATPYETPLKAANETTSGKPYAAVIGNHDLDLSGLTAGITSAHFKGFLQYGTGTSRYIAYALGFTPTDDNTIYVKKTGDDGDAGTYAAPKLTIAGAIAACTGLKTHIVILDSGTYSEGGFTIDSDCVGIYAAVGCTPTIQLTRSAANTTATITTVGAVVENSAVLSYSTAILANGHVVHVWVTGGDLHYMITSRDGADVYTSDTTIDNTGNVWYGTVCRIADDKFAVAWGTGDGTGLYPYRGKWQIYTEDTASPYDVSYTFKTILGTPQAHEYYTSGQVLECSCHANSYGNILILFKTTDGHWHYKVNDSSGSMVHVVTDLNMYSEVGVGLLTDDSWVVAGKLGSDTPGLKTLGFIILDYEGNKTLDTVQVTDNAYTYGIGVGIFADDKIGIFWSDRTEVSLIWAVYNVGGEQIADGITDAGRAWMSHSPVQVVNGDLALVVFYSDDDDILITFLGIDGHYYGSQVVAASKTGVYYRPSIGVSDAGNYYVVYNDSDGYLNSADLDFDIWWDGIKVTSAAEILGVTIDGGDIPYLYRLIHATAAFTRKWCECKGATYSNEYNRIFGLVLDASDDTVLRNNLVHDNAGGDYIADDDADVQDNDYYRQSTGYCVCVDGAGSDIVIEHNQLVSSAGGVRLKNNDGSESLDHNIMHDNSIYDVYADTDVAITYGDLTGTSDGTVNGTLVISVGPLFISDGTEDPDDTDHRLMVAGVGDYADSPCLRSGSYTDGLRDLGCYDVRIVDVDSSYVSATIGKPWKGITVRYKYVGRTVNQMADGSYRTSYDAMSEEIEIEHNGLENDEFDDLFDALTVRGDYSGMLRFRGNPVTEPDVYIEVNCLYENITGSAMTYRLNQTGRQKIKYILGRRLEL